MYLVWIYKYLRKKIQKCLFCFIVEQHNNTNNILEEVKFK